MYPVMKVASIASSNTPGHRSSATTQECRSRSMQISVDSQNPDCVSVMYLDSHLCYALHLKKQRLHNATFTAYKRYLCLCTLYANCCLQIIISTYAAIYFKCSVRIQIDLDSRNPHWSESKLSYSEPHWSDLLCRQNLDSRNPHFDSH